MAVANTAFDEIASDAVMVNVAARSDQLRAGLNTLVEKYPNVVAQVRGKGMLIGVKIIPNNREFMVLARAQKLLIAGGGENCVRLLPPLYMTEAEAAETLVRFERGCNAAEIILAQTFHILPVRAQSEMKRLLLPDGAADLA